MAHRISDLTLDEIVSLLIAGEVLEASGGVEFSLPLSSSRAILALYNQDRRAYWNPDKDTAIQDGEIDRVLAVLDNKVPAGARAPTGRTSTIKRWQLTKIAAHRFRGLHRHCTDSGTDPDPFKLEITSPATLIRGFNGAGKTSLMSAICWCLTGYGYRSQALPAPLHDSMSVHVDHDDPESESLSFEIPAIVPVPTELELVAVDGKAKADTWVKLTFKSLTDGSEIDVERHLERDGKKAFKTQPVGLEKLGLPDLALQVGTLMPGIAAATRFEDKTTLSQAVSTLTGLRPLAHFGTRSVRLLDRLRSKYPKEAKGNLDDLINAFSQQKTTLDDFLGEHEELPRLDCVIAPNESDPNGWSSGLDEAERRLKIVEDSAAKDAACILGSLPNLTAESEVKRFSTALEAARNCFSNAALKGLPAMQVVGNLAKLQETDISVAEDVLRGIEDEAERLVARLSDPARAGRLRLYGLVAKWHDTAHPGLSISACPVCASDLTQPGAIPNDALLDRSVVEALEDARKADAALLKTAAEWERDTVRALNSGLPNSLQPFLNVDVPDDLGTLYIRALSKEVFEQSEFPEALRGMAAGVAQRSRDAWENAPDRSPLPDANLPKEIPDREGLRRAIKRVRRAINLAKYRAAHADFAKGAVTSALRSEQSESAVPANQRSVTGQVAALSTYLDAATVFASLRRQLSQLKLTCEKWVGTVERIKKLELAAKAVEPFTSLPSLVHDQVAGLIADLDSQTRNWAERIYKAQFVQAPSYAGLDSGNRDGFTFLAAHGKHKVEAHRVLNASALRAYLSSFVLALWEQIWTRTGGVSVVLMDDPQDLLDPSNVANLAATMPRLVDAGMSPLVVSNDFGFVPAVEAFLRASGHQAAIWEFSSISTSKCTASLAPIADEVRTRSDLWQRTDPNDVALARAFVHPVRVRIEVKLWDLLASDPSVLRDPTLNDLLGKIANARNRGERPFNEEPFKKLIELPGLKPGAPFRDAINKAHHGRADQISPAEAEIVLLGYEEVFTAIDACWLSYARFMGRLPPEQAIAATQKGPAEPTPIQLRSTPISIVGRLAAHELGTPLINAEDAVDGLELLSLGEVSLFTLRAPTMGLVALPGQTLIVSLNAEVRNGDFAVVQTPGRTFARRIGIDKSDLSRIALETMPSTSSRVPQTHFVQRSSATLSKVVGVLFDEPTLSKSPDEAIPATASAILSQVIAAAKISGDSAFPVAPDNGHVLLGRAPDVSQLGGRIVAVVTTPRHDSPDHFAYLKRLGKQMPSFPNVYYLENVGQSGEGEYVQFPSPQAPLNEIPIVTDIWKVLGTIF